MSETTSQLARINSEKLSLKQVSDTRNLGGQEATSQNSERRDFSNPSTALDLASHEKLSDKKISMQAQLDLDTRGGEATITKVRSLIALDPSNQSPENANGFGKFLNGTKNLFKSVGNSVGQTMRNFKNAASRGLIANDLRDALSGSKGVESKAVGNNIVSSYHLSTQHINESLKDVFEPKTWNKLSDETKSKIIETLGEFKQNYLNYSLKAEASQDHINEVKANYNRSMERKSDVVMEYALKATLPLLSVTAGVLLGPAVASLAIPLAIGRSAATTGLKETFMGRQKASELIQKDLKNIEVGMLQNYGDPSAKLEGKENTNFLRDKLQFILENPDQNLDIQTYNELQTFTAGIIGSFGHRDNLLGGKLEAILLELNTTLYKINAAGKVKGGAEIDNKINQDVRILSDKVIADPEGVAQAGFGSIDSRIKTGIYLDQGKEEAKKGRFQRFAISMGASVAGVGAGWMIRDGLGGFGNTEAAFKKIFGAKAGYVTSDQTINGAPAFKLASSHVNGGQPPAGYVLAKDQPYGDLRMYVSKDQPELHPSSDEVQSAISNVSGKLPLDGQNQIHEFVSGGGEPVKGVYTITPDNKLFAGDGGAHFSKGGFLGFGAENKNIMSGNSGEIYSVKIDGVYRDVSIVGMRDGQLVVARVDTPIPQSTLDGWRADPKFTLYEANSSASSTAASTNAIPNQTTSVNPSTIVPVETPLPNGSTFEFVAGNLKDEFKPGFENASLQKLSTLINGGKISPAQADEILKLNTLKDGSILKTTLENVKSQGRDVNIVYNSANKPPLVEFKFGQQSTPVSGANTSQVILPNTNNNAMSGTTQPQSTNSDTLNQAVTQQPQPSVAQPSAASSSNTFLSGNTEPSVPQLPHQVKFDLTKSVSDFQASDSATLKADIRKLSALFEKDGSITPEEARDYLMQNRDALKPESATLKLLQKIADPANKESYGATLGVNGENISLAAVDNTKLAASLPNNPQSTKFLEEFENVIKKNIPTDKLILDKAEATKLLAQLDALEKANPDWKPNGDIGNLRSILNQAKSTPSGFEMEATSDPLSKSYNFKWRVIDDPATPKVLKFSTDDKDMPAFIKSQIKALGDDSDGLTRSDLLSVRDLVTADLAKTQKLLLLGDERKILDSLGVSDISEIKGLPIYSDFKGADIDDFVEYLGERGKSNLKYADLILKAGENGFKLGEIGNKDGFNINITDPDQIVVPDKSTPGGLVEIEGQKPPVTNPNQGFGNNTVPENKPPLKNEVPADQNGLRQPNGANTFVQPENAPKPASPFEVDQPEAFKVGKTPVIKFYERFANQPQINAGYKNWVSAHPTATAQEKLFEFYKIRHQFDHKWEYPPSDKLLTEMVKRDFKDHVDFLVSHRRGFAVEIPGKGVMKFDDFAALPENVGKTDQELTMSFFTQKGVIPSDPATTAANINEFGKSFEAIELKAAKAVEIDRAGLYDSTKSGTMKDFDPFKADDTAPLGTRSRVGAPMDSIDTKARTAPDASTGLGDRTVPNTTGGNLPGSEDFRTYSRGAIDPNRVNVVESNGAIIKLADSGQVAVKPNPGTQIQLTPDGKGGYTVTGNGTILRPGPDGRLVPTQINNGTTLDGKLNIVSTTPTQPVLPTTPLSPEQITEAAKTNTVLPATPGTPHLIQPGGETVTLPDGAKRLIIPSDPKNPGSIIKNPDGTYTSDKPLAIVDNSNPSKPVKVDVPAGAKFNPADGKVIPAEVLPSTPPTADEVLKAARNPVGKLPDATNPSHTIPAGGEPVALSNGTSRLIIPTTDKPGTITYNSDGTYTTSEPIKIVDPATRKFVEIPKGAKFDPITLKVVPAEVLPALPKSVIESAVQGQLPLRATDSVNITAKGLKFDISTSTDTPNIKIIAPADPTQTPVLTKNSLGNLSSSQDIIIYDEKGLNPIKIPKGTVISKFTMQPFVEPKVGIVTPKTDDWNVRLGDQDLTDASGSKKSLGNILTGEPAESEFKIPRGLKTLAVKPNDFKVGDTAPSIIVDEKGEVTFYEDGATIQRGKFYEYDVELVGKDGKSYINKLKIKFGDEETVRKVVPNPTGTDSVNPPNPELTNSGPSNVQVDLKTTDLGAFDARPPLKGVNIFTGQEAKGLKLDLKTGETVKTILPETLVGSTEDPSKLPRIEVAKDGTVKFFGGASADDEKIIGKGFKYKFKIPVVDAKGTTLNQDFELRFGENEVTQNVVPAPITDQAIQQGTPTTLPANTTDPAAVVPANGAKVKIGTGDQARDVLIKPTKPTDAPPQISRSADGKGIVSDRDIVVQEKGKEPVFIPAKKQINPDTLRPEPTPKPAENSVTDGDKTGDADSPKKPKVDGEIPADPFKDFKPEDNPLSAKSSQIDQPNQNFGNILDKKETDLKLKIEGDIFKTADGKYSIHIKPDGTVDEIKLTDPANPYVKGDKIEFVAELKTPDGKQTFPNKVTINFAEDAKVTDPVLTGDENSPFTGEVLKDREVQVEQIFNKGVGSDWKEAIGQGATPKDILQQLGTNVNPETESILKNMINFSEANHLTSVQQNDLLKLGATVGDKINLARYTFDVSTKTAENVLIYENKVKGLVKDYLDGQNAILERTPNIVVDTPFGEKAFANPINSSDYKQYIVPAAAVIVGSVVPTIGTRATGPTATPLMKRGWVGSRTALGLSVAAGAGAIAAPLVAPVALAGLGVAALSGLSAGLLFSSANNLRNV